MISAGDSTVKGLSITHFAYDGIVLTTKGNNKVYRNWIGLDTSGAAAGNGQYGININGSSSNAIGGSSAAERNVIAANGNTNVHLEGGASDNVVSGNYIGTDPTGTSAIGGSASGIRIFGDAGPNTFGGTAAGAGNVINGSGAGIFIQGSGSVFQGNLIGTDKTGMVALGNGSSGGILIAGNQSGGNTIGGTAAGARNIISGNANTGINVEGGSPTPNLIEGNFIGTDVTGAGDLGNGSDGIRVAYSGDPTDTVIGGTGGRRGKPDRLQRKGRRGQRRLGL